VPLSPCEGYGTLTVPALAGYVGARAPPVRDGTVPAVFAPPGTFSASDAREGATMAEILHTADVHAELRTAENGAPVRYAYRSARSKAVRMRSGTVVDAYSPTPAPSSILVDDGDHQHRITPDGEVRSEKVGTLGKLTRLSID